MGRRSAAAMKKQYSICASIPFGRISLLLHLSENTICLIVYTVGAFGHLAVAFDFLLPAHVAGLQGDNQLR